MTFSISATNIQTPPSAISDPNPPYSACKALTHFPISAGPYYFPPAGPNHGELQFLASQLIAFGFF